MPVHDRAGAELVAQPGVLVVGVDQDVVDLGKLASEPLQQVAAALPGLAVQQAVGRRVVDVLVPHVGRAEVEQGAHAGGVGAARPQLQVAPPPPAPLGRLVAEHRHRPGEARRHVDHVFQVERLAAGAVAPGDVQLQGIEPQLPEARDVRLVPLHPGPGRAPQEADAVGEPRRRIADHRARRPCGQPGGWFGRPFRGPAGRCQRAARPWGA